MFMRERAGEGFKLVTWDERMGKTALKLGFEVLPAGS